MTPLNLRAAAVALLGLSTLFACFSTPSNVGDSEGAGGGAGGCVGAGCKHGDNGGVGSAAGSSTGGGSTGAASSAGGSSGGNSGASVGSSTGGSGGGSSSGGSSSVGGGSSGNGDQLFTCGQTQAFTGDGGSLCGDSDWFATKLIDLETCNPLGGVAVQAIGGDGVPISGSSATSAAGTGVFVVCVPAQEPVTMSFNLTGYPQTYYSESLGTEDLDWIGMLDNDVITEVTNFIPGGVNLSLGTVAVFFSTRATGCPVDNWAITLNLPDGGALADGGYDLVYMDGNSIPETSLTATSGSGIAILYNIDTSATNFFEVVPTTPDAGACYPRNMEEGYTGRIYVTGNAVSYEIFNL